MPPNKRVSRSATDCFDVLHARYVCVPRGDHRSPFPIVY